MTIYGYPYKWLDRYEHERFVAEDYYDITEEIYEVPRYIEFCSLAELVQYPSRDIKHNTMVSKCSNEDIYSPEPINCLAIGERETCFHSTPFQEVKALSPYVHELSGLTVVILNALADSFRMPEALNNHSYVRFGPEQVYSISHGLKEEILNLDNTQLRPIAEEWVRQTETQFTYKEKPNRWGYVWDVEWDISEYTVDYFMDVLLNMYEILRYCDPEDTLYISVDY